MFKTGNIRTTGVRGRMLPSALVFLLAFILFLNIGSAVSGISAQSLPVTQDGSPVVDDTIAVVNEKKAFGAWLFGGEFANQSFIGFNPSYEIAVGDKISLKMWGGFDFTGALTVDAQGNIFIPKVGPVSVASVQNKDLNAVVTQAVKNTFRKNVGVYASLDGAEPVKVFVTGFVKQPGLYAGHSSDSVLFFLDKAGGIDPNRGSFLDIKLLRAGEEHKTINLYQFILSGNLPVFQIADGDTIVVSPIKARAEVTGDVHNAYAFEFEGAAKPIGDVIDLARPLPQATHVRINRNNRARTEVEYLSLKKLSGKMVYPCDVLEIVSDKNQGTISVRVEGETNSAKEFILPYGAKLGDVLAKVDYGKNAQPDAIQLMRTSVKQRQKVMLEAQLRALESSVLTARSNTVEEANLRQREAELILKWVDRARGVEPKGQVSLAGADALNEILLEPGDVIRIPRASNLVLVHGEVLFPSAIAYRGKNTVEDYIKQAGGFTQSDKDINVLILHKDGSFGKLDRRKLDSRRVKLAPGDEIFVLPRVATKHVQIAKDIISILYQLALSAGVVLAL